MHNLKKDTDALLKVYDKFAPSLFTFISKLVTDDKLAEEVLEKTFVKFAGEIDSYKESDDLFIKLLNIARSEAVDTVLKSKDRQLALFSQLGLFCSVPLDEFIATLDPLEKSIFVLSFYKGLCFEDIAQTLKVRVEFIKVKVSSTHSKLKHLFPAPASKKSVETTDACVA
jgi:DNA-directed RNA polymerase specialized sigma24 family protein